MIPFFKFNNPFPPFNSPVELISVDGKGLVKCYRQTSADQFVLHHEGSFRRNYPRGINAAALVESHGLIIVAGNLEPDSSMNKQEPNIESGITAWRLVNDVPYYSMAFSVGGDTFRMDSRSLWSSTLSALLFRHSTTVRKHLNVWKIDLLYLIL